MASGQLRSPVLAQPPVSKAPLSWGEGRVTPSLVLQQKGPASWYLSCLWGCHVRSCALVIVGWACLVLRGSTCSSLRHEHSAVFFSLLGDANRQISEYKFKLSKAEQDITTLEQSVSTTSVWFL